MHLLFYRTLNIDALQARLAAKRAHLHGVDHLGIGTQHALPDPGQIPQVEDVVELGRGWQHLNFGGLPQTAGQRHQLWHHALNLPGKTPAGAEVTLTNHTWVAGSGVRQQQRDGRRKLPTFHCSFYISLTHRISCRWRRWRAGCS